MQESKAPLSQAVGDIKPCAWDPNSYANCDQILTTLFHLELSVDFGKSSLIGSNTINLTATADGVT